MAGESWHAHCELVVHEGSYPCPTWRAWHERIPVGESAMLHRIAKVEVMRDLPNTPDYYGRPPEVTDTHTLITTRRMGG